jgi:hypothetical protein
MVPPSALAVSPIRLVMPDGTAYARAKQTMVSDEMPGDTADHRSL